MSGGVIGKSSTKFYARIDTGMVLGNPVHSFRRFRDLIMAFGLGTSSCENEIHTRNAEQGALEILRTWKPRGEVRRGTTEKEMIDGLRPDG